MVEAKHRRSGRFLGRREERILRLVVEHVVTYGFPVGSRTVSKLEGEHLSAASIRNTMADLEELGYLAQPHVSAGRMPTDRGYRYYVDALMEEPSLPLAELEEIRSFFLSYRGMVGSILERTSHLLSHYSHYIGIVSAPQFESTVFRHVEFIRQGERRVLVIFVSQTGLVHNKLIEVRKDYPQEELDRISRWVVDEFSGMSLAEVRTHVQELMREERARIDDLANNALEFSSASFEGGFGEEGVYVEGAANIVGEPEFSDPEQIQFLIQAVEEKGRIVELLNRCLDGEGVRIVIGSETELSGIEGCSLVASAYSFPDGSCGSVAVLGPTRMPYPRTVFLVDYISKQVSRAGG